MYADEDEFIPADPLRHEHYYWHHALVDSGQQHESEKQYANRQLDNNKSNNSQGDVLRAADKVTTQLSRYVYGYGYDYGILPVTKTNSSDSGGTNSSIITGIIHKNSNRIGSINHRHHHYYDPVNEPNWSNRSHLLMR